MRIMITPRTTSTDSIRTRFTGTARGAVSRSSVTDATTMRASNGRRWRGETRARRRVRDRYLLFGHVDGDVREQRRAQIALPRIGKHAQHRCSLRRVLAQLKRAGEGGARGGAAEDALLLSELLAPSHGVRPGDRENAIDHARVHGVGRELGDEVGAPTLQGMGLPRGVAREGGAV